MPPTVAATVSVSPPSPTAVGSVRGSGCSEDRVQPTAVTTEAVTEAVPTHARRCMHRVAFSSNLQVHDEQSMLVRPRRSLFSPSVGGTLSSGGSNRVSVRPRAPRRGR